MGFRLVKKFMTMLYSRCYGRYIATREGRRGGVMYTGLRTSY